MVRFLNESTDRVDVEKELYEEMYNTLGRFGYTLYSNERRDITEEEFDRVVERLKKNYKYFAK